MNLKNYPVIPDAELPKSFQVFSQPGSKLVWGLSRALEDCPSHPFADTSIYQGNVVFMDKRVIKKVKRHGLSAPAASPCLCMCKGLVPLEGAGPYGGDGGKRRIFMKFQRFPNQVVNL